MNHKEISKATLGRIPLYLQYLKSLPAEVQTVSSTAVAKELGFGEVQVRKDFAVSCGAGKPKVGYIRGELIESLEKFLSCETGRAVVVGAGKLGTALLSYTGFEEYGCSILAAFDSSINSELILPNGKSIFPMEYLSQFCSENSVQIGIISVPKEAAQEVLNSLCEAGIKSILCFAQCRLYKPADVTVQYENLALSLAHLKLKTNI